MEPSKTFSHLNAEGEARMVDVGDKQTQQRRAVAVGSLVAAAATLQALKDQALPKGDVLAVARIAGIQGAKQTSGLIPLCHPLPLNQVSVDFDVREQRIDIRCEVKTTGKTGVEMEALSGVSVAALTLYDMMKAVDKDMHIEGIRVESKEKL